MTLSPRTLMEDRTLLSVAFLVGSIGGLLQIAGGYWDVSWHTLRVVETFYTPAHLVLYTGVVLVGLAALAGLILILKGSSHELKPYMLGLKLAILGVGLQVFAGGFDQWWHSMFGFDPVLFTPPHAILIVGMLLNGFAMSIGVARLLSNRPHLLYGRSALWILGIVSLTALWLDLNAFVYLITDVTGMDFTLGTRLANPPYSTIAFLIGSGLLALNGTSVLLAAKKILVRPGSMSLVGLASALVSALANITFRGIHSGPGSIPQYGDFLLIFFSFLVPIALFDLLASPMMSGLKFWLGSALLGLFAFGLDGWYASTLWTNWVSASSDFTVKFAFLYAIPFALFTGFLAMALQRRFSGMITGISVPVKPALKVNV